MPMATAPAGRNRARLDRAGLDLLLADPQGSLEIAFNGLPIGVLVCTPHGDRANAELRRIVRFDERRLDHRALERRLRPVDGPNPSGRGPAPFAHPIASALAGDSPASQRLRIERGDGTTGVVRVTARPLTLSDGPGAVVTVADETATHEAERLRDAFLGIVGHELRSPISSVLAAAELLEAGDLAPDIRAEVVGGLGDEARRLNDLVEQLIRLADVRAPTGAVSDEPTHLPHLVRRRIVRWRQRQPRLTLKLDLADAVPPVAGEEGYVAQVLDILVDNALKYAGSSEPVIVRIERGDDEVRVHVLDSGPGLPADDMQRIFGLFWRAVPARRSTRPVPSGHGIGLFVARSIVEALRGRIWARNRPEGGADVGFALPISTD